MSTPKNHITNQRTVNDSMSKSSKKSDPQLKLHKLSLDQPDIEASVMHAALAAVGLLCMICTIVFDKSKGMGGVLFPIICLLCVVFLGATLAYDKKLTTQNVALLIIAAGFILRLNYVIYTPLSETVRLRQHDMYSFGGEKGHSAYIEHFFNNGFTLPDFDPTTKAQFYHPPLHHLLAAMWMRILTTLGMSYTRAIGSLQFLSLFYSTCCMFVSERIFTTLRMRGSSKLLALAIVAFHPTFIIMAGSVNNDILSILFILLAVYTAILWYEDSTVKNIVFIALSIGLGMSTKLSTALVAIPISGIFAAKLIKERKRIGAFIRQYIIFGLICLPLGLWFPIRNMVRFGVPITYVHRLSEDSDQYIGFYSKYERLFDLCDHPFQNVFLNRISTGADFYEHNILVALIKTSVFGEYNFADTNPDITPWCWFLLIMNMIIIALSIIAFFYYAVRITKHAFRAEKYMLIFYQVLMFAYFVKFCFDFPHNCSMDFRYIVPSCVLGAFFIGASREQFSIENRQKTSATKAVNIVTAALVILFCLSSTIVYIMLGAVQP